MLRIVRSGAWLYDHSVLQPVDIVALDCDVWWEIDAADGHLEEGDEPTPMGAEGFLYYVRFRQAGAEEEPTWVDSAGYQTVEAAMAAAEARAPSSISWA